MPDELLSKKTEVPLATAASCHGRGTLRCSGRSLSSPCSPQGTGPQQPSVGKSMAWQTRDVENQPQENQEPIVRLVTQAHPWQPELALEAGVPTSAFKLRFPLG